MALAADAPITGWLGKTVTPDLYVRCRESKTEVLVATQLPANPELGHYAEATVTIRFDKSPAQTLLARESTDREALFLPGGAGLVRTMLKAERMLFRFTPFNSPSQETTFTLVGLSRAVKPLQKACGWS